MGEHVSLFNFDHLNKVCKVNSYNKTAFRCVNGNGGECRSIQSFGRD